MTTTTAAHNGHTNRHPLTSRKDHQMFGIELRLASINERQSLERSIRDADRAAFGQARSIRSQLGESIIRLGRRVAGESLGSPALTG
ncbi:MAG TPA: hypothetical protein VGM49_08605 [Candidatus Limnocylindrales bacterium]|jgi:hypothetical protein